MRTVRLAALVISLAATGASCDLVTEHDAAGLPDHDGKATGKCGQAGQASGRARGIWRSPPCGGNLSVMADGVRAWISRTIGIVLLVPVAILGLLGVEAPWSLSGWVLLAAAGLAAASLVPGGARVRR